MPAWLNGVLPPDRCEEHELEYPVQVKRWPNGRISSRLMASQPTRTWSVTWDGLSLTQVNLLKAHYESCKGMHLPFTFTDPHTSEMFTVKYASSFKRKTVRPGVMLYKVEHKLEELR
jgi:hypothetical protein